MKLRALSPETMLTNSNGWLRSARIRGALEEYVLGAGALVELQSAHDLLAGTLGERKGLIEVIRQLGDDVTELDDDHDGCATGLHGLLTAIARIARDPDRAARFLGARAMLFPAGLSIVKWSYSDECGQVLEVERRITPDVRQLLAETRVGDDTLIDVYDRWIAAGKRLGEKVQERARLRAQLSKTPELAGEVDTLAARRRWIQTVRVFLDIVDLLPLDAEQRRAILAPLVRDIAAAERAHAVATDDTSELEDEFDGDESEFEDDFVLESGDGTEATAGDVVTDEDAGGEDGDGDGDEAMDASIAATL